MRMRWQWKRKFQPKKVHKINGKKRAKKLANTKTKIFSRFYVNIKHLQFEYNNIINYYWNITTYVMMLKLSTKFRWQQQEEQNIKSMKKIICTHTGHSTRPWSQEEKRIYILYLLLFPFDFCLSVLKQT